MAMRDAFFFVTGLGFLFLAKSKNVLTGYVRPKPFGTSETERCVAHDIRVVDNWMHYLERYLQTDAMAALRTRDVLELGPGSDLGTGLYLLSKGVGTYSACDVNDLAAAAPDALYEALFSRISEDADMSSGEIREELVRAQRGDPSRINSVVRHDFDLVSAFRKDSIDLVFSNLAFEHFDNIDATVSSLSIVCRPEASIVAQIDLKTHSRWIGIKDPNNIYRYPRWLYDLFWFRGQPNRLRPKDYAEAFDRHGWTDIVLKPVKWLDAGRRASLDTEFRDSSNQMDQLSVILCARKKSGRNDKISVDPSAGNESEIGRH